MGTLGEIRTAWQSHVRKHNYDGDAGVMDISARDLGALIEVATAALRMVDEMDLCAPVLPVTEEFVEARRGLRDAVECFRLGSQGFQILAQLPGRKNKIFFSERSTFEDARMEAVEHFGEGWVYTIMCICTLKVERDPDFDENFEE